MNFKDWKKIDEDGKTVKLQHPKGHVMIIAIKALPKIHQEQIKRLEFAHGGDILDSGKGGMSSQGEDVRFAHKQKKRGESSKETMNGAKEEAKGRAIFEREFVRPKLKGLAKGGEVKYKDPALAKKGLDEIKSKHEASRNSPEGERARRAWADSEIELKNMGRGPLVRHYAEGADNVSSDDDMARSPDKSYSAPPPAAPTVVINTAGQQQPAQLTPGNAPIPQPPTQINPATAAPQAQGPQNGRMVAPTSTAFKPPVDQPNVYKVNPADSAPNGLNSDNTANYPEAVKQQAQSIQDKAEIEKAQARGMSQSLTNLLGNNQQANTQFAQNYNQMADALDAYKSYTKENPINEKAYLENMSTKSKIATGIGLFLGGFGTAFGGHNYAQDFLKEQIDRNIDAQKARADQQKTVYGFYEKKFGNDILAEHMAKASALSNMADEVNLQAARSGDPAAAARAKELTSILYQQQFDNLNKAAAIRGTLGQGTPMSGQTGAQNQPSSEHILSPNAGQISSQLTQNPLAQQYLPAIQEQKAKADLADKAIDTINQTFPTMKGETSNATYSKNTLEPFLGSVPFVGGALEKGAASFSDIAPSRRKYDVDKSAMVGAVRGALQGNVSDELLDSVIKANVPEFGDSQEISSKKLSALKEFIKSHTRTDLLKQFNLAK